MEESPAPAIDAPVVVSPDEALYQHARLELKTPKPPRMTGLLYIALFFLFVAGQFSDLKSVSGIVVIVLAVVFHEAGHALGMRLFGFRDVRMFFIPFFGAAVSGRPRGVAAWKEALVSLLGPLPGIVVGLIALFLIRRSPTALSMSAVQVLIFLNVFNLLPFGFLDGGRFLGRVLFSRHRVLEIGFLGVGSLLLGIFALSGSMYLLAIFALLGLVTLPLRWRTLKAAAELRRQNPGLVPDPDNLAESDARAAFAAARDVLRVPAREQPSQLAGTMESIVDAAKPAPGVLATLGLLALYGFGLLSGTVGVVLLASETGPANWEAFAQPEWRAEFPRKPQEMVEPGPGGVEHMWRAAVEGTERFTVTVTERGPGDDEVWMNEAVERLARRTGTTLVGSEPVAIAGGRGRQYRLETEGRIVRARVFVSGTRGYEVVASAPAWAANQQHFFDSFALVDPARSPSPPP